MSVPVLAGTFVCSCNACDGAVERCQVDQEDFGSRSYTARGTTVLTRVQEKEIKKKSRIIVAIRKRPLSSAEANNGFHDAVVVRSNTEIELREPKVKVDMRQYTHVHRLFFDEVFDECCSNVDVYLRTAQGLLDTVFEGGWSTCFAYGQTGSGKTHTMLGNSDELGLYALAVRDMFDRMGHSGPGGRVQISFYEIYGGRLYDLLNFRKVLRCLEDDKKMVNVRGLSAHLASSVDETMKIIERGNAMRSSGSTSANDTSSRSHAILTVELFPESAAKPFGKLSFIDLAGSERGADTFDCTRQTRMEGAEINKSLLALKECIRFLDQNKKHVPFRGSKLTEVLRDSFIGNSKTVMIGAISPGNNSCEHTLNTLRYADRVKELRKNPKQKNSIEENEQSEIVFHDTAPRRGGRAGRKSARPTLSSRPVNVPPLLTVKDECAAANVAADEVTEGPPSGEKRPRKEAAHSSPRGSCSASPCIADRGVVKCESSPIRLSAPLSSGDVIQGYRVYLSEEMARIKEEFENIYKMENNETPVHDFVDRANALLNARRDSTSHVLTRLCLETPVPAPSTSCVCD